MISKKNGLLLILLIGAVLASSFFLMRTITTSENLASAILRGSNRTDLKVGAWLWKAPTDFSQHELEEMLTSAENAGIKELYVSIDLFVDITERKENVEKQAKLREFDAALSTFVKRAHERGIETHALAGGPEWTKESHRYIPHLLLTHILEYNKTVSRDARIEGIQFDIEPFSLPSFTTPEGQREILTEYITLVNDITERVKESGEDLTLGFAIPYWLDGETRQLPLISYENATKATLYHIIDILSQIPQSYLAVMAYRTEPSGPNGTIALTKNEIVYANKTPVKIVVGQETTDTEPTSITFYAKSKRDLRNAIRTISLHYDNDPSFGGVAIHDLSGYGALKDK